MSREFDRADEIFIAEAILNEPPRARDALPFGTVELAQFLTSATATLTQEQTRRLFSDNALRQAYKALQSVLAQHMVPQLMAASDGQIEERKFPGGHLKLVPSQRAGQIYLRLDFDQALPSGPAFMLLETSSGTLHKLGFTVVDQQFSIVLPLNDGDEHHSQFIEALRDPTSSGCILQTRV